jgi:uncharacterized membrane protein (DUF485 family)
MERDDIIEYSLDAHHSEEEGRKIRRNIWMVTLLLAVVTTVEVALGAYWKEWFPTELEHGEVDLCGAYLGEGRVTSCVLHALGR